jgi:5-methylthioribose kinase
LVLLTAERAIECVARHLSCDAAGLSARELGGGVSNRVFLVETPSRALVLKQALPRLRVAEEWLADPERLWRESAAIRLLRPLLPAQAVPEVVFEDRAQQVFAMTAAPGERTWKTLLMSGDISTTVARNAGRIHAALMRSTADADSWIEIFGDLTAFDQLRLDPYYRFTARRHPQWRTLFDAAIARCRERRVSLVHGDWSPKNMMVDGVDVTVIDFEVIHYGDPSFDSAFLLNHLALKSLHMPAHAGMLADAALAYWGSLEAEIPAWFESATLEHLPLLMLARVDGKSPAEYIESPALKDRVRGFAGSLLERPPRSVSETFRRIVEDSHS